MSQLKGEKPQQLQRNLISEQKNSTEELNKQIEWNGKDGAEAGIKDKDHCLDCGKLVLNTHDGLVCDICGFWHHSECEKVSEAVYDLLYDHADDTSIAWYSKKCSATSRKFKGTMLYCIEIIEVLLLSVDCDWQ